MEGTRHQNNVKPSNVQDQPSIFYVIFSMGLNPYYILSFSLVKGWTHHGDDTLVYTIKPTLVPAGANKKESMWFLIKDPVFLSSREYTSFL